MADSFLNFVEEEGLDKEEEIDQAGLEEPDEEERACLEDLGDEDEVEGPGDEEPPEDEDDEDGENKARALQLDHQLDPGKFHVGCSWIHLDGLTGKRERYNGLKFLVVSFGIKNPAKVKVRSRDPISQKRPGQRVALWVYRVNCRNTVHKQNGAWNKTQNQESTGATGASRWVALGRNQVDEIQGKLKFRKTEEEEAERNKLFEQMDVNNNECISLAELDKALPEVMGCVALFNAKPAIIRAFLAATGKDPARSDNAAFSEHKDDYCQKGEEFRVLMQYLHEYFEMYLIFQDMGDANEDRRIDIKEWANFITSGKAQRVGIKVTPEMLEDKCGDTPMPGYSLFNQIDVDQGGCILFKEFSDFCIRKGIEDPERSEAVEAASGARQRGLDLGEDSAPLLSGPEDAPTRLRLMFHNSKDLPGGISHEKFSQIVGSLGLDEDEIAEVVSATDANGSGRIEVDEFCNWLFGDGVCDEDREMFANSS
eukprot:TRINITY_DN27265_c0_g1_i1.p1 TRINITY_DN27265_c0_g1~~TRINITY_DN27265_c0_g1_i1.p1  ORF type:complete len:482 (-),score=117.01 TRINITY_DN27265_c0_g1_i1:69-1514(-)